MYSNSFIVHILTLFLDVFIHLIKFDFPLTLILQVCQSQEYQRKLHPDDLPLRAQQQRTQRGEQCHFIVRKNPHYPRRRQLLPPIVENKSMALILDSSLAVVCDQVSDLRLNNNITITTSSVPTIITDAEDNKNNNRGYVSVYEKSSSSSVCKMCRNTFRLCDFCQKKDAAQKLKSSRLARIPTATNLTECSKQDSELIYKTLNSFNATTYNPVYNIREIRTDGNSFSSLGIDKKILAVETNHKTSLLSLSKPDTMTPTNINRLSVGGTNTVVLTEAVNNDPAKGYGNFVYI